MELLKWIIFFSELTSEPALENRTIYDVLKNKLQLLENGSIYEQFTDKNGALYKDESFNYTEKNDEEHTANFIQFTARYGFKTILQYMIENKAEEFNTTVKGITEIIQEDYTVTHLAVEGGHLDIVKYLIDDNGIDPMVRDNNYHNTLLHAAVSNNNIKIVKYLVENKEVDLNPTNIYHETPLHISVIKSNIDVFKYLVESGANCTDVKSIYYVACEGKLDIMRYLVEEKHQVLNVYFNVTRYTPLHCACQNGHLDVVKYMIKHKADLNMIEPFLERTPLYFAIEYGNLNIVKYFINELNVGVEFKFQDDTRNALLVAVDYKRLDIIKYLVDDKKISIYVTGSQGETPMHVCAENGFLEGMKYFVDDKKANLSVTDLKGQTILKYAVATRFPSETNFDMIKYLVEKGANVNAVDIFNDTILHAAVCNRDLEVIKYLIEVGNAVDTVLNNDARTILHTAVIHLRGVDIVEYLIRDRKLGVSAVDKDGCTALHYATGKGGLETVKCLLENGADVNVVELRLK